MRVEVVENIQESVAVGAQRADETSVKLALQSFQSALEGDASFFDGRRNGDLRIVLGGAPRAIGSGSFLLSFRDKKFGSARGLYFQVIQKLVELLKDAGSPESLETRLCLLSDKRVDATAGALVLTMELEATGDSSEQAMLRWGLGLAHLQQALLFTSRYLRQQTSQKNG